MTVGGATATTIEVIAVAATIGTMIGGAITMTGGVKIGTMTAGGMTVMTTGEVAIVANAKMTAAIVTVETGRGAPALTRQCHLAG